MSQNQKIAVLGAGAWGTALAAAMCSSVGETILWARNADQAKAINETGENKRYLPGAKLPNTLTITNSLDEALEGATIILMVIPAQQMRDIVMQIGSKLAENATLISCAKGIEQSTGLTMSQMLAKQCPTAKIAALSGPSFAADVVVGLPTAVTLAAEDYDHALALCKTLSSTKLRCYANDDLLGVDYGGALKNVLAIAAGIVHGKGLGASALAATTTRGFAELQRLALALGAKQETLTGLSGLGDLILSCASEKSRNFAYGASIGRGDNLTHMKLAEGAATASIAAQIARDNKIEAPLITTVSAILDRTIDVDEALDQLLARPVKREID